MKGGLFYFENNHMIKLKTEWYLRLHKTMSNLLHDKYIVHYTLDNTIDDVISVYCGDKNKLKKIVNNINHYIVNLADDLEKHYIMDSDLNIKNFCVKNKSHKFFSILITKFKNPELDLMDIIKDHIKKQTKIDKMATKFIKKVSSL